MQAEQASFGVDSHFAMVQKISGIHQDAIQLMLQYNSILLAEAHPELMAWWC